MAITDPIGDLLTRIRNGQLRGLAKIKSPNSRLRARAARCAAGRRLHPRLCGSRVQGRRAASSRSSSNITKADPSSAN